MPTKEPKVPMQNEGQDGPTAHERLTQAKSYAESFLAWCDVYAPDVFAKVQPAIADAGTMIEIRLNKLPNIHATDAYFFELIQRNHPDFPFELFGRWKEECKGEPATSFEPPLPQVEGNDQVIETEEPSAVSVADVAPPAQTLEPETKTQPLSSNIADTNEHAPKALDPMKWLGTGRSSEAA